MTNLIVAGQNGVFLENGSLARKHGESVVELPENCEEIARAVIELSNKFQLGKTSMFIVMHSISATEFYKEPSVPKASDKTKKVLQDALELDFLTKAQYKSITAGLFGLVGEEKATRLRGLLFLLGVKEADKIIAATTETAEPLISDDDIDDDGSGAEAIPDAEPVEIDAEPVEIDAEPVEMRVPKISRTKKQEVFA